MGALAGAETLGTPIVLGLQNQNQLLVLHRMEGQLQRFYDEMERILVELDTVRGNLISVSASSERANQERLAGEVRALREEVGAVAAGMSEAYESG